MIAGTMVAQVDSKAVSPGVKYQLGPVPAATAEITDVLAGVSHSDLYCAGFITRDSYSREHYVLGGVNSPGVLDSPTITHFGRGDVLYLEGAGYEAGTRVSVIRQVKDPNRMEIFDKRNLPPLNADLYAELGYADIIENRKGVAVAKIEYSCDSIVPGDLVVPFVEKAPVMVRHATKVDMYPAEKPRLAGKIVAIQDWDQFVGSGHKVYFNLGTEQGIRPGDYFLITRGYSGQEMDLAEAISLKSTTYEDEQKNPGHVDEKTVNKFPRRIVGELVVLEVTSAGSTGMVTFSTQEVHPGDVTESEQ
jgi:hypothetical protein